VRDGHQRVSVARALGQLDIRAEVTVWRSLAGDHSLAGDGDARHSRLQRRGRSRYWKMMTIAPMAMPAKVDRHSVTDTISRKG